MNQTDIRAQLVALLQTIAPETAAGELDAARPLRDQIDLDSMDWLNFLVAVHERLKVDIPESDYAKLGTLDDLAAYLSKKTPKA